MKFVRNFRENTTFYASDIAAGQTEEFEENYIASPVLRKITFSLQISKKSVYYPVKAISCLTKYTHRIGCQYFAATNCLKRGLIFIRNKGHCNINAVSQIFVNVRS